MFLILYLFFCGKFNPGMLDLLFLLAASPNQLIRVKKNQGEKPYSALLFLAFHFMAIDQGFLELASL